MAMALVSNAMVLVSNGNCLGHKWQWSWSVMAMVLVRNGNGLGQKWQWP